ncbi:MAG: SRPBCC domain-containing protein [Acidimicrobiia bacterium]|nr:SRPBCC domain-containing protein [Acidimicrobiia bacterium]
MRFEESFVVEAPREVVWRFFEERGPDVGMCIPGAESVEETGEDRYRVRVTQKVGTIGATFDLKAEIKDRTPIDALDISAIGRSVKGARGDLRAKAAIALAPNGSGTQIDLVADLALGGMLGSLGHKVIAQKAAEVTREFAQALTKLIQDESGGS